MRSAISKHEQDIQSAVSLRGTVSVAELSQMLGVSDQTIRRIVKPMVARGEVTKVHGAIVSTTSPTDPPFQTRMNANRAAKVAIANHVADLVPDGAALAIDTGSTSGFVAQALRRRRNLTVVTNSAFIASTLSMIDGNRTFMAGTQLRNHDGAAFDRAAFEVIAGLSVDITILSASLVHPERGFLAYDQCEIDIARAMMQISQRNIMAVDASKFVEHGRKPALRLPQLMPGDIVVTDRQPSSRFATLLEGLSLRVASESQPR